MRSLWLRIMIMVTLGFGALFSFSGKGFAYSNVEQRTMLYYTCYGTSNITNNSTVGGAMGEAITSCSTTSIFPTYYIYVSGTMVRDGRPVDSTNMYAYNTNSVKNQQFYRDRIYRTGKYTLTSTHKAVSGYNHNTDLNWYSEYTRSFY